MSKLLVLYLYALLISSCALEKELDSQLLNFDPSRDKISWNTNDLPVSIASDNSFSADEKAGIDNMITEWEVAANVDLAIQNQSFEQEEFSKIEDYFYKDSKFGIHRASNYVEGLEMNVVAACQIFLEKTNETEDLNFYEIKHADIIFNDFYFNFGDGATETTYDFQSIVLHELGHFFGMLDNESKIMADSTKPKNMKRILDDESKLAIEEKYKDAPKILASNTGIRENGYYRLILYKFNTGELKIEMRKVSKN